MSSSTSSGTAKVMGLRWTTKKVEFNVPALETYTEDVNVDGYRGVDDFFNIREANPNIRGGQWQLEVSGGWSTYKAGSDLDDDIFLGTSLKYAYTDNFNIEIELLPLNLGDGTGISGYDDDLDDLGIDIDQPTNGNGELNLKTFWQIVAEHDLTPAMALWAEARFPSGCNSSKVDGTAHFNMTKTLANGVRGHFEGWVKSANGARGDADRRDIGDRRDFQWGAGLGMDFSVNAQNLLLVNWLNRASEYDGNSNTNSIEAGWVYDMSDSQSLMLAGTYNDTHGPNEGPRWTTGVQWSLSW